MGNNIEDILRRISEKSEELADIFGSVAGRILEELSSDEGSNDNERGKLKSPLKEMPTIANRIVDGTFGRTPINIFPGGIPGICHRVFICKAFGKWNSFKSGFKGTAKYLTTDYFKNCGKINNSILILTFAWDQLDFIEQFKDKFDIYTNQNKTICVVLVTTEGFSIQYLR